MNQLSEDELIQEVGRLHLTIIVLQKSIADKDKEIEDLRAKATVNVN